MNHTNYARDGVTIMDHSLLFTFFVRCLLLLCVFLCQQLPSTLAVAIDREKFLDAFVAQDEDQNPITATQWDLGPDGLVRPPPTDVPPLSEEPLPHSVAPTDVSQSSKESEESGESKEAQRADGLVPPPPADVPPSSEGPQPSEGQLEHPGLSDREVAFLSHMECYEFLAKAIPAVPNTYPGYANSTYLCICPQCFSF